MKRSDFRAHIEALKLQQKQVAVAFVEALPKDEEVALNTATTKLSKLLADHHDGVTFFASAARRAALAAALKLPLDVVVAALDAREVILDPRFPRHVSDALVRQGAAAAVSVRFISVEGRAATTNVPKYGPVRVTGDPSSALALRDVAAKNPAALVVLANEDDRKWYADSGCPYAFVSAVARGFELSDHADWLPVPPLGPARTWSRANDPLLPNPELTAMLRAEAAAGHIKARDGAPWDQGYPQNGNTFLFPTEVERCAPCLFDADERGVEPSYPLVEILRRLDPGFADVEVRHLRRAHSHEETFELSVEELRNATKTVVWWRERQLFGFGPATAALATALGPHHDLAVPAALTAIIDALAHANPFDDLAWKPLLDAARDVGLDLALAQAARKSEVAGSDPVTKLEANRHAEREKTRVRVRTPTEGDADAIRSALMALAERPLDVERADATLPFRLKLAARSEFLELPKDPFDVVHAIAQLGAGRTMRIRIAQFRGAGSGEMRADRTYSGRRRSDWRDSDGDILELDGDGTHVWIETRYDPDLDGARPGRRIRGKAAIAADDD